MIEILKETVVFNGTDEKTIKNILEKNKYEIKKYSPKYNILLKDEKTYPFIKISKEDFPSIKIVRTTKALDIKSGEYFGPYPYGAWRLKNILMKLFKIRDCNRDMKKVSPRPCLKYYMKSCTGPCVYKDIKEEYNKDVEDFLHTKAIEFENSGKVYIHKGDARKLDFIKDESIDFICTHPPYANIIKYSEDIEGDLSQLKVPEFLAEMKLVASESYRVLRRGKFCAILMGDTRIKGHIQPLGFEVMKIFEGVGFKLKEIIIKEQHNCKATGYWKTNSIKYNFFLIAHEYLFIFKK